MLPIFIILLKTVAGSIEKNILGSCGNQIENVFDGLPEHIQKDTQAQHYCHCRKHYNLPSQRLM